MKQAPGSAIAVVRCHDQCTRGDERQHKMDGGHPTTGDDRACAALEFRERISKLVARRIARTRVVVDSGLAKCGKGIVRGKVDRRRYGTESPIIVNAYGTDDRLVARVHRSSRPKATTSRT